MLNLTKIVKPWKEAGALGANLNLYGFWDETTFLTKTGDLGLVIRVAGIDHESLDSEQQVYAVERLQGAMKTFGLGFHVYQYLFKSNRPRIPFAHYEDELIDTVVEQRHSYFERKSAELYEVEIFYAIVLEGRQSKGGLLAAIKQMPSDPKAGLRELKAQFASNQTKVLLRKQIKVDRETLHARAGNFCRHLADFMRTEVLGQQGQFTFLRRLLNFERTSIAGRPQTSQFLDYQVANSNIEAERDHLRIGRQYVRLLTMKEAVSETRPLLLAKLLSIPSSFHAVIEWTAIPKTRARSAIKSKKRHFNANKGSVATSDKKNVNERDQLIDEEQQDDLGNLGECLKLLGAGQTMGEFSFTVVLHGDEQRGLARDAGEFMSLFTEHDGQLFEETYNQLNALFATVPGNYTHNLRKLYLLNTNFADLSFLFTIHEGERWNRHLNAEYLAVLETDYATPYYLNLHSGELAHTLILGKTGSGKSFLLCFLLLSMQKYRPLCFLFDIGGSFQSLTEILGGAYLTVGQESRDFTINPFSLEPTPENLQFLFSFFQVLIEGQDRRYPLDTRGERGLWEALESMYTAPREQRTISTLAALIGAPLSERLHRWTRAGQYGFLFDNVEDTLSFQSFQAFNFAGWSADSAALEPLLFYILHRTAQRIMDPAELGRFKAFAIDEAWSFVRNETIRNYIVAAEKTWRKHNAAMILATQSLRELEESGLLSTVAESCPTRIFLHNPGMAREVYAEAFGLNDTELSLIAGLLPHGELLIQKPDTSKKARLTVDSASYWIATNNAPDNLRKQRYFARFGVAEGVQRLAEEHPRGGEAAAAPRTNTENKPQALTLAG
jgi:type IV secretion/conjugal transfer VirB4 family ATPase